MLTTGPLIIAASVALMATVGSYWMPLGLLVLAGLGNGVFHPADSSILNSSMRSSRMGRGALYGLAAGTGAGDEGELHHNRPALVHGRRDMVLA